MNQRHDISRLRAEKNASEDVIKLQELRDQLKVYKLDIEDLEAQLHDKTQGQAVVTAMTTTRMVMPTRRKKLTRMARRN